WCHVPDDLARDPSGSRLVTRIRSRAQDRTRRSTSSAQVWTRCSQLSRTISTRPEQIATMSESSTGWRGRTATPTRRGDGTLDPARLGNGRELGQPDAVWKVDQFIPRHGQREPGLANATNPDERDDPMRIQKLGDRGLVGLA